jgi:RNA polymerase sigma-70 factor (ECF subfamily)
MSRKEHLSTKEIAERLGIAPKTVENQLTVALNRLRKTLGDFVCIAAIMLCGRWF